MIEGVVFLASSTFFGGSTMGNLFTQWEQLGLFSFLLPFLLIFALVFGILTRTEIFKDNRPVNAIIAFVVSLLSLQFGIVSELFSEIFPRLGIGLAFLLVAMILIGMFTTSSMTGILFGIGAVIFLIIVTTTAGAFGSSLGDFWVNNWGTILIVGLIIWALTAMMRQGIEPSKDPSDAPYSRSMRG